MDAVKNISAKCGVFAQIFVTLKLLLFLEHYH